MRASPSDLIRFEEIALLLSSTASLPHYKYYNKDYRYNYIVPISNPSLIISTRIETIIPNTNPVVPESIIPICGDVYQIAGIETPVCSYIAYSTWNDKIRLSTHCEKVLSLVIEEARMVECQKTMDCKAGSILKGLPLSSTMNVIEMSNYF